MSADKDKVLTLYPSAALEWKLSCIQGNCYYVVWNKPDLGRTLIGLGNSENEAWEDAVRDLLAREAHNLTVPA